MESLLNFLIRHRAPDDFMVFLNIRTQVWQIVCWLSEFQPGFCTFFRTWILNRDENPLFDSIYECEATILIKLVTIIILQDAKRDRFG